MIYGALFLSIILQCCIKRVKLKALHEERIPVELNLRNGRIRGFESIFLHRRIHSFLSVPFAEPPIGEDRFRPPKPKKPWSHTLKTSELSPACYQGRDTYNETFWGSEMWNANTPIREDCLYLNIWTPAEARNLTVMVWLFGGGYYYGSPSLILYDGRALALQANVVVVNINYRVGPFGYLYLDDEEVPGNMGMLDQQMALQWVQDNVAAFGGDPKSVTLFGESAGAASIVAHLIAPGSQGLFKRGILQSGSLDNHWSLDSPEHAMEKSQKLIELLNCTKTTVKESIRCMKALPPDVIVSEIWSVGLQFLEFPFVIVSQDQNFFRDRDAFVALRTGEYSRNVPLIIGINHDEGNFWNIYNLPQYFDKTEQPQLTRDEFLHCVQTAFATRPIVVRDAASFVYMGEKCEESSSRSQFYAEQVNQMVGDSFFTCDSVWLAEQMRDAGVPVYIYYFDQPSSANPWPRWTGVMHGYEIEYVFGIPIYNTTAGYTPKEKAFSEKIINSWGSFAINGVPRLSERAGDEWPEFGSTNKWIYLRGGSHIKPIERRKEKECAMWRSARDLEYEKYLLQRKTSNSPSVSYRPVIVCLIILALQSLR